MPRGGPEGMRVRIFSMGQICKDVQILIEFIFEDRIRCICKILYFIFRVTTPKNFELFNTLEMHFSENHLIWGIFCSQ